MKISICERCKYNKKRILFKQFLQDNLNVENLGIVVNKTMKTKSLGLKVKDNLLDLNSFKI